MITRDGKAELELKLKQNDIEYDKHVAHGSKREHTKRMQYARDSAVNAMDDIISNAVWVEEGPSTHKHVAKTHRFYTAFECNQKKYALRIVAHEQIDNFQDRNNGKITIIDADVYDLMIDKELQINSPPLQRNANSINGSGSRNAVSGLYEVSQYEILNGVKSMERELSVL